MTASTKTKTIRLPYRPRQFRHFNNNDIHEHPARFKVLVAHRRFGKSVLALNHILRRALEKKNWRGERAKKGRYAIVCPQYKQAKSIYWTSGLVYQYLPKECVRKYNKTLLQIEFKNGAVLEFLGSDDYDKQRGSEYDELVMDEFSEQDIDAWRTVFRYTIVEQAQETKERLPGESDRDYETRMTGWEQRENDRFKGGGVMFMGTLKGRNHLWSMWLRAQCGDEDWMSWMMKASETGLLSDKDIEEIRREIQEQYGGNVEAILKQELECEPMYFSGLIYPEFSDKNIVEPFKIPDNWRSEIEGSFDHGLQNPTASARFAIDPEGNLFITDEYYIPGKSVHEHAPELRKMYQVRDGETLTLVADPATQQKNQQNQDGIFSIADAYEEHLIHLLPGNNDVLAGINRVKDLVAFDPERTHPLTGAKGSPKLFVFSTCKRTIEEFEAYMWQEGKADQNEPQKPKKHRDHLLDSIRYYCSWRLTASGVSRIGNDIAREVEVDINRIIARASGDEDALLEDALELEWV